MGEMGEASAGGGEAHGRRGLLRRRVASAGRIRGKLILLHTVFSLALAVVLLAALRPAVQALVREAMSREAVLALEALVAADGTEASMEKMGVAWRRGSAPELGIGVQDADAARGAPGTPVVLRGDGTWRAAAWDAARGEFVGVSVDPRAVEGEINNLYLLLTLSLLAVYGVIALTLEVFVLPRQVYAPIERLRRADAAVQEGERGAELIPDSEIPNDELGEIMRSRNRSILKLREQEHALEGALERLEEVAGELKRKNHLLETARRNLADQDRLASLGMMSAGIAHELNTPLAVLKGSVEQLAEADRTPDRDRVALMLRVVKRLERLSESLLDFARVRGAKRDQVRLRDVVEEAWTLVSIDRQAKSVRCLDEVPEGQIVVGDSDRLTQVFVNLLRNGVDALDGGQSTTGAATGAATGGAGGGAAGGALIVVRSEEIEEDSQRWVRVIVRDNGPGLDPGVLPSLFEPFASTRLDSHGTGLGLAVAEGIVKEHGGVIIARNATAPDHGAEFEVTLPASEREAETEHGSIVGERRGAGVSPEGIDP